MKPYLVLPLLFLALAPLDASLAASNEKAPKVATDRELGFFLDGREATLTHIRKVGMLPVTLPEGFDDREELKAEVEKLVRDHLEKAGLKTTASSGYASIYDRFNRQLGGIYNPDNGSRITDRYNAVEANARREFMENEQLDGYVLTRIVVRQAPFFLEVARWDGVQDSSNGRIPGNAIAKFLVGDTSTGTLPGYSLIVQISNAADKIVFGRAGGIQLASYYSFVTGSGWEFPNVPKEKALRDSARLERAVRVATLPLLHTPLQIAEGEKDPLLNPSLVKSADLPPPPEGVVSKPASPLLVPRDVLLGKVKNVVVAQAAAGDFDVDQATRDQLTELVRAELQSLGWQVTVTPAPNEALAAEMKKLGGLYDPLTGKRDEARVTEARKGVFRTLPVTPAPDALMYLVLRRVTVDHDYGDVAWDGVTQNALTLGPVKKGFLTGSSLPALGKGTIHASSLSVTLRDAEDRILYSSRGGLQLVQQLKNKEPVSLAPAELFKDPSRFQPAVHVALRELTMTPEQIELELNPPKKGKR